MRYIHLILLLLVWSASLNAQGLTVLDDFEGNGTITTWQEDECEINTSFNNPYQTGINTSATVLEYNDVGGQYANVRFEVSTNFDLSAHHTFSLKIYVPSGSLTGSQPNQVSLKLQNGTLTAPWSTQSEIIKPISTDQWQTVTFDFQNDNYINLDPNSAPPTQRSDFNRVVIQINGENNTDHVTAYLDDVNYDGTLPTVPVFDQLIWSDEFDEDGAINSINWFPQTQLPEGQNWFNGEVQHYTDRTDNAFVENGVLKIVAKKETYSDQGVTKQYTSARLNAKFSFKYGKVEVRAKLPTGVGTWPAIWMLGVNIDEDGAYWDNQGYGTTPWPACGEIDIMEHWGNNQNYVQSAIHTPSSFGGTVNLGGQNIGTASTDFHVYSLEWTAEKMVFSVDDNVHYTYDPPVKDENTWPFDLEQYLLLNVAVLPNIQASFNESAMEIDYVRIYQQSTVSNNEIQKDRNINIYPNPFSHELNVRFESIAEKTVTVKIYGTDGKLVHTSIAVVNNEHIKINNLENLPEGIYYVNLVSGKENFTFKVIKD